MTQLCSTGCLRYSWLVLLLLAGCTQAHREVGVDLDLKCDAACEIKLKAKREAEVEK